VDRADLACLLTSKPRHLQVYELVLICRSPTFFRSLLDEFEWRFNNRANPFLFRDTILMLVEGDTLPYRELVDAKPHPLPR